MDNIENSPLMLTDSQIKHISNLGGRLEDHSLPIERDLAFTHEQPLFFDFWIEHSKKLRPGDGPQQFCDIFNELVRTFTLPGNLSPIDNESDYNYLRRRALFVAKVAGSVEFSNKVKDIFDSNQ